MTVAGKAQRSFHHRIGKANGRRDCRLIIASIPGRGRAERSMSFGQFSKEFGESEEQMERWHNAPPIFYDETWQEPNEYERPVSEEDYARYMQEVADYASSAPSGVKIASVAPSSSFAASTGSFWHGRRIFRQCHAQRRGSHSWRSCASIDSSTRGSGEQR